MLTDIWEWICDNIAGIIIVLVALCLFALFAFAIGEAMPHLTEGVVVGKHHTPASSGVSMIYTGKVMVPVRQYRAAMYKIQVRGVTEDGEERTEWWIVTQTEWEQVELGDTVRRDGHE